MSVTAFLSFIRNSVGRSFGIFSRLLNAIAGSGPCCRFEPSCSHYGREAVERYGMWRGSWLAFGRVLRCRPGGEWGFDPVPQLKVLTAELGNKI